MVLIVFVTRYKTWLRRNTKSLQVHFVYVNSETNPSFVIVPVKVWDDCSSVGVGKTPFYETENRWISIDFPKLHLSRTSINCVIRNLDYLNPCKTYYSYSQENLGSRVSSPGEDFKKKSYSCRHLDYRPVNHSRRLQVNDLELNYFTRYTIKIETKGLTIS